MVDIMTILTPTGLMLHEWPAYKSVHHKLPRRMSLMDNLRLAAVMCVSLLNFFSKPSKRTQCVVQQPGQSLRITKHQRIRPIVYLSSRNQSLFLTDTNFSVIYRFYWIRDLEMFLFVLYQWDMSRWLVPGSFWAMHKLLALVLCCFK